jgi:hypothetical protein
MIQIMINFTDSVSMNKIPIYITTMDDEKPQTLGKYDIGKIHLIMSSTSI